MDLTLIIRVTIEDQDPFVYSLLFVKPFRPVWASSCGKSKGESCSRAAKALREAKAPLGPRLLGFAFSASKMVLFTLDHEVVEASKNEQNLDLRF